jgi:hypothetical protein
MQYFSLNNEERLISRQALLQSGFPSFSVPFVLLSNLLGKKVTSVIRNACLPFRGLKPAVLISSSSLKEYLRVLFPSCYLVSACPAARLRGIMFKQCPAS